MGCHQTEPAEVRPSRATRRASPARWRRPTARCLRFGRNVSSSRATLVCVRVEQTTRYRDWLDGLRDRLGRARIQVRVDRLVHGNPGQHRELTEGVSELKIDHGPGYRVYYTQRGTRLILLLAGGDKSTQQKDIAMAIELAKDFQE